MGRERSEDGHASLRISLREVPEALRARHDPLRTREGRSEVSDVQRQQGRPAVQWFHDPDREEELTENGQAASRGGLSSAPVELVRASAGAEVNTLSG